MSSFGQLHASPSGHSLSALHRTMHAMAGPASLIVAGILSVLILAYDGGLKKNSFLGPLFNRYMNERALKTFVAAVLLAIGLYYLVL